ncbi:MAG TPA: DUF2946 family protein [Stellaceae bacterium]|nr:DUF2946 family protein [Stellaceae bacterium]
MRRRWMKLGAWLGAIAIAVSCYLPHHFTTDILHALDHLRSEQLALAAHEHAGDAGEAHHHDHSRHHHHDGCAICVAFAAGLAATTLPAPVDLAPPGGEAVTHLAHAAAATVSRPSAHTPYAPRAPPALS